MDDDTVRTIIAMIDSRRLKNDQAWRDMERGTRESGENLAVSGALADLKWAIVDVWRGDAIPDDVELLIEPHDG